MLTSAQSHHAFCCSNGYWKMLLTVINCGSCIRMYVFSESVAWKKGSRLSPQLQSSCVCKSWSCC
jgi:hypothetical protein